MSGKNEAPHYPAGVEAERGGCLCDVCEWPGHGTAIPVPTFSREVRDSATTYCV
jgi:hypothetical protein